MSPGKITSPRLYIIRSALTNNIFPMFVAEGSSDTKLARINHHAYLHKGLRSFSSIRDNLFIFGHSLATSDDHILRKIERGFIRELYVSIYGDATSPANRAIISRATELATNRVLRAPRRPLEVIFYDAASADVWG